MCSKRPDKTSICGLVSCAIVTKCWCRGDFIFDRLKSCSAHKGYTSSVKCWTANVCIHAGKGPVIIMNQIKSFYNSLLKDSHSHPIHTCFPIIASNELPFSKAHSQWFFDLE